MIRDRMQQLQQAGYLPRYRLPRWIGCAVLAFFLLTLLLGSLILFGGPLLLGRLAVLDPQPIFELQTGLPQTIRSRPITLLRVDTACAACPLTLHIDIDDTSWRLDYDPQDPQSGTLALPDGSLLRVLAVTPPATVRLQWLFPTE